MCGSLEGEIIEIEVEDTATTRMTLPGTDVNLNDMLGGLHAQEHEDPQGVRASRRASIL